MDGIGYLNIYIYIIYIHIIDICMHTHTYITHICITEEQLLINEAMHGFLRRVVRDKWEDIEGGKERVKCCN